MISVRTSGGNMICIKGTISFLWVGWKSAASGSNGDCGNCGVGISVEGCDGGGSDDCSGAVFTGDFGGGESTGSGVACLRGGFLLRTVRTDSRALDLRGDRFFFM